MINTKCKCEIKVSSQKLDVLKTASSEKVALAKKYGCFIKVGILDPKKEYLISWLQKISLQSCFLSKVLFPNL